MVDWVVLLVITGGLGDQFKSIWFLVGIEEVLGWPASCGGFQAAESGFTERGCGEEQTLAWSNGSV